MLRWWKRLATPLGVGDRAAAERRYRRLVPPTYDYGPDTQEGRVAAGRTERATQRAVAQWVAEHADQIAEVARQVVAVPDLDQAAWDWAVQRHREVPGRRRFGPGSVAPDRPTWPDQLRTAVTVGDAAGMFSGLHYVRHALVGRHPKLVEAAQALYATEGEVRWAVESTRLGPDPDGAEE